MQLRASSQVFFSVDTDGSGELDVEEFNVALTIMGVHLSDARMRDTFAQVCLRAHRRQRGRP